MRNRTYLGEVEYNKRAKGRFSQCNPETDRFVVKADHEPLIDQALFDRVQARIADATERGFHGKLDERPEPLLAGVLRCGSCDSKMTVLRRADQAKRQPLYLCAGNASGETTCDTSAITMDVADSAVLNQIRRVRFVDNLDASTLQPVASEPDPRDLLTKQLAAARAKMEKLSSGFMLMVAEASDAEKQAYRKIANALSDEIMALEQALRDLPSAKRATEDVEAWRAEFSRVDLGGLIDGLLATDQRGKLRHVIAGLVDHATIDDRFPEKRSTWAHASVTWSPNLQALVDAGSAVLADDDPGPERLTKQQRRSVAMRKYRTKVRGQQ